VAVLYPNNRLNSRSGCLLGTSCPFSTHCRPECQSLIRSLTEMIFLANLRVNLHVCLCGGLQVVSAQTVDFLDVGQTGTHREAVGLGTRPLRSAGASASAKTVETGRLHGVVRFLHHPSKRKDRRHDWGKDIFQTNTDSRPRGEEYRTRHRFPSGKSRQAGDENILSFDKLTVIPHKTCQQFGS